MQTAERGSRGGAVRHRPDPVDPRQRALGLPAHRHHRVVQGAGRAHPLDQRRPADPRDPHRLLLRRAAGVARRVRGPVAISIAMLVAAGMKPVKAAIVSLLANTAPVAFGAMAAPIIALSGVTGIDIHLLAQMAGRQTPFLAAVRAADPRVHRGRQARNPSRRGRSPWWRVSRSRISQFVTSNFIAVEITDIVASVVTLVAVLLMLRVWKPQHTVLLRGRGEAPVPDAACGR